MTIRKAALLGGGYLLVASGFLFAACDSMSEIPANITITDGDQQTAVAGTAVADAPAVRVTNNNGDPLAGVSVSFAVQSGGGSVSGGSATTDVNGIASVTTWTLGGTAGPNTLSATVMDLTAVTFTATGTVGSPASVSAVLGDNQIAPIGTTLPISPQVRVTDMGGNPVSGAQVTFSVALGGGTITDSVQTTDANGDATMGMWTLGGVIGLQTLTATVTGANPLTISATGQSTGTITIVAGDGQAATVNTAVATQLQVLVQDLMSNPLTSAPVTFAVTSGGGSLAGASTTTDGAGMATLGSWTLGTTAGANVVTASVPGLSPASFTATGNPGPATQLLAAPGVEGQLIAIGEDVIFPPTVIVADQFGNGVGGGTSVDFAVTVGGGTVVGSPAVANAAGRAAVTSWTLGGAAGANRVDVTSVGLTSATINASGVAPGAYDVDVRMVGSPLAAVQTAANNAAVRWESLIVGDLSDVSFATSPILAGTCGDVSNPLFTETVDDLVLWVQVRDIDGPGGVLGSAGPCRIRTSSNLPVVGSISLDSADAAMLDASGLLEDVVLHEMGHIIGIGTVWDLEGLVQDPSLPADSGIDTHFTGPIAIGGFDAVGGTTYTAGEKVPVENELGGAGTRDAHWRETTLDTEMMTGFIDNTNPISLITVGSLGDLGYAVSSSNADAFSVTFPLFRIAGGAGGLRLYNDVSRAPIGVVDASGVVLYYIRPN